MYIDDLSDKLNSTDAGYPIGNLTLNHMMCADDLCCLPASAGELEDLVDVRSNYAKPLDIVVNCKDCWYDFFFKGYTHVYALQYEY